MKTITKNSGKASVSKIVRRDEKRRARDLPQAVSSQLEEHTEGFLLFYIVDGQFCIAMDQEGDAARVMGMRVMAKNYLDAIIDEDKEFNRAMAFEQVDEF